METSEINIRELGLMSTGDVARYLNLSISRIHRLTESYDIPHVELSTIKVYLKSDIDAFQEGRKANLRFGPKIYQKENKTSKKQS